MSEIKEKKPVPVKTIVLVSVGFVVAIGLVVGGIFWYRSQHQEPKPDTSAYNNSTGTSAGTVTTNGEANADILADFTNVVYSDSVRGEKTIVSYTDDEGWDCQVVVNYLYGSAIMVYPYELDENGEQWYYDSGEYEYYPIAEASKELAEKYGILGILGSPYLDEDTNEYFTDLFVVIAIYSDKANDYTSMAVDDIQSYCNTMGIAFDENDNDIYKLLEDEYGFTFY